MWTKPGRPRCRLWWWLGASAAHRCGSLTFSYSRQQPSGAPQREFLHLHMRGKKPETKGAQSCPTLCSPMDCSPPGSPVHGIFQPRVLEWVAISFSRGSSQPKDRTGSPTLQATLYRLSHQGSPKGSWSQTALPPGVLSQGTAFYSGRYTRGLAKGCIHAITKWQAQFFKDICLGGEIQILSNSLPQNKISQWSLAPRIANTYYKGNVGDVLKTKQQSRKKNIQWAREVKTLNGSSKTSARLQGTQGHDNCPQKTAATAFMWVNMTHMFNH